MSDKREINLPNVIIKKILFKNDSNFIIGVTTENFSIKGTFIEDPDSIVDTKIDFVGKWESNPKYGNQFVFSSYSIKANYTFFFLTNIVKGIPSKAAKEVVVKFGDSFGDIVERNPRALLQIKGIGEQKLKDIVTSYTANKHLKSLADMLLPYGLTPNTINKIYGYYKEKSVQEIKTNPYLLTRIKGIGFRKADEIALKFGISFDDANRVKSAILFAMEVNIDNGHTYIQKDLLISNTQELLNTESFTVNTHLVENGIVGLVVDGVLINFDTKLNLYATKKMYEMELFINSFFKRHSNERMSDTFIVADVNSYIEQEEGRIGFKLSDKQKEIIKLANSRFKIISLSGYAGAGKTTASQSVLRLFETFCDNSEIVCCALSGAAANRAKTVTGFKGFTIHSLLDFSSDGFGFNQNNKLPHKVILLDEASMVDTYLFYSLLQAIDIENTTLIIAGDPAQLQPVGAGNIYKDILEYNLCRNVTLDKVYRQREDQIINVFAQHIRLGEVPAGLTSQYADFGFIDTTPRNYWQIKKSSSPSQLKEFTNGIHLQTLEELKAFAFANNPMDFYYNNDLLSYINHFQVISPMKAGVLGVDNINNVIQSIFNPFDYQEVFTVGTKVFKPKDKVIHLKNENMEVMSGGVFSQKIKEGKDITTISQEASSVRRVFNGQFGVILGISGDKCVVYYPNEKYVCFYTKQNFSDGIIGLSYAISIHKSQGSQFNNVAIPSTMSHYIMLNNQLMYTAVTRAKDKLMIIGEKSAFETACKNSISTQRNTILSVLNS